MIVVTEIQKGARLRIAGGLIAEVIQNMGDGEWLRVRIIDALDGNASTGAEELCHATDVVEQL